MGEGHIQIKIIQEGGGYQSDSLQRSEVDRHLRIGTSMSKLPSEKEWPLSVEITSLRIDYIQRTMKFVG